MSVAPHQVATVVAGQVKHVRTTVEQPQAPLRLPLFWGRLTDWLQRSTWGPRHPRRLLLWRLAAESPSSAEPKPAFSASAAEPARPTDAAAATDTTNATDTAAAAAQPSWTAEPAGSPRHGLQRRH